MNYVERAFISTAKARDFYVRHIPSEEVFKESGIESAEKYDRFLSNLYTKDKLKPYLDSLYSFGGWVKPEQGSYQEIQNSLKGSVPQDGRIRHTIDNLDMVLSSPSPISFLSYRGFIGNPNAFKVGKVYRNPLYNVSTINPEVCGRFLIHSKSEHGREPCLLHLSHPKDSKGVYMKNVVFPDETVFLSNRGLRYKVIGKEKVDGINHIKAKVLREV